MKNTHKTRKQKKKRKLTLWWQWCLPPKASAQLGLKSPRQDMLRVIMSKKIFMRVRRCKTKKVKGGRWMGVRRREKRCGEEEEEEEKWWEERFYSRGGAKHATRDTKLTLLLLWKKVFSLMGNTTR